MKRGMIGAAFVVATVLGSATAAQAGERKGNGGDTPAGDNARSLCAYSGLEDFDTEGAVDPGVTQNWGQIVRVAGPLGGAASTFVPGEGEIGCNAHLYPNK